MPWRITIRSQIRTDMKVSNHSLHPSDQLGLETKISFVQTAVLQLPLEHGLKTVVKMTEPLFGLVSALPGDLRPPQLLRLALPRHIPPALSIDTEHDNTALHLSFVSASFDRPRSQDPFGPFWRLNA